MSAANPLGPLAVALADLVAVLSAEDLVAVRAACADVWPGWLDQADAAAADTVRELAESTARDPRFRGVPLSTLTDDAVPGWLRLALVETLLAWGAGRAATCRHAPDWRRPAPVHAAVWRPRLVSCAACAGSLFRLAGDRDVTCDRCGHVDCGGVYAGRLARGPLTVWFGLCGDCRRELPVQEKAA